jgi:hypothetical protein
MKCPYLVESPVLACKAGEKPYSPSLFQLHEYCKNKNYKKCPFLLKLIMEKRKFCNGKNAIPF